MLVKKSLIGTHKKDIVDIIIKVEVIILINVFHNDKRREQI